MVTDVRLDSHAVGESGQKEQLWQVALDRTAFYPGAAGSPGIRACWWRRRRAERCWRCGGARGRG